MKIGIITYWDSNDNYGQLLQCYALQAHLRTLGHAPFLIRYRNRVEYKSGFKLKKLVEYILNFKTYLNFVIQTRDNKKYSKTSNNLSRDFDAFRNKYVTMTENIYDQIEIYNNPPDAEAYICGSDQIWSADDVYYLPFVRKGLIKIAYAPSFGGENPFIGQRAEVIKSYLKDFSFIGMREKSGVNIVNRNGFNNAIQVIDPTLLLTSNDYDKLLLKNDIKKTNNAFVYLLGSPICCDIKEIMKFINERGFETTYAASQGRVDKFTKELLTIPQWINAIKEAPLVVTNSFHCVVFSLIYHRPFIFVPLDGSFARMNDRLIDILSKSNLTNRVYKGDFNEISDEIDFSTFDNYIKAERLKSNNIFSKYL